MIIFCLLLKFQCVTFFFLSDVADVSVRVTFSSGRLDSTDDFEVVVCSFGRG